MKRRIIAAFLLAALAPAALAADTTTNAPAAAQISIALLPLADLSRGTNDAHWQDSFPRLLALKLYPVRSSLRVLPKSSVEFAFRESGLTKDHALTTEEARQLGKIMEAQYVFAGSYERRGTQWRLNARLVATTGAQPEASWTLAATNWLAIGDDATGKILRQLDITPGAEAKNQMLKPVTKSPEALDLMLGAYFNFIKTRITITAFEAGVRRAIALDAESAQAWRLLARVLLSEQRLDEAQAAAERAVTLDPDNASSHEALASVQFFNRSYSASQELLKTAMTLDPDDDEVYIRLSDVCARLNQWDEAVSWLKKAEVLAPYDPAIHAELGRAYADSGKEQEAFAELGLTQRFAGADFHYEQVISEAYSHLNALPEEAEHLRKWINFVERSGIQDPALEANKKALILLEERLTPHFIMAKAPRAFTAEELNSALKMRLTPYEQGLVINPLICAPEMKLWAEQLTAKATNALEKAQDLFSGLTRRASISRDFEGKRSAAEAFKDWSYPKFDFSCQEFTLLYLALARSIGLDASYCYVTRDYKGTMEHHACAGVFFPDGRALLVDPSYHWFGVPHEEFQFLDDLQVVGAYESQLDGLVKSVAALKLAPELQFVHHNLAMKLADAGLFDKARQVLDKAPKSDSTEWQTLYTRAVVDEDEKKWPDAIPELQQSIQANPAYAPSHLLLGTALFEQHQYQAAREQLRLALQGRLPGDLAAEARVKLLQIESAERIKRPAP